MKFTEKLFGTHSERELKRIYPIVDKIEALRPTMQALTDEELFRREADVIDFNWISGSAPAHELRCKAKIRYRHPEQLATVMPVGSDAVRIVFDEPQRAITPGQAAVLYDGDTVLGGGVIQKKTNGKDL